MMYSKSWINQIGRKKGRSCPLFVTQGRHKLVAWVGTDGKLSGELRS